MSKGLTHEKGVNHKGKRPTAIQLKTFQHIVANGGKMSDALRAAGASQSIIRNPQKVTKSKGFSALLDKAGLTDRYLAQKHQSLLNATRREEEVFYSIRTGKKKWRKYTDEEIKIIIEGKPEELTGCKLICIKDDPYHKARIAVYRHPESAVQSKQIEMAYKVKGHFAPQKLDITEHELSEEERAFLLTLVS